MRNIKNLKRLTSGFTLVELLIVIGLLGAIALIVIAAINPIEQANRARDTRFRADSGQLISAIDRYFAARAEFPWMTVGIYPTGTESSFGFVTAQDAEVGICGATCDVDGELIIADELKTEFRNRDFIQRATTADKRIFIGKSSGSSASVYACFIPLANATKRNAVADQKVYTIDPDDGTRAITTACDATDVVWADNGCYVCIPE